MHIARLTTRQISVGQVKVGGDAPVSVQSMCSTDTRDVTATVAEIHRLEAAGCEIIRVAVPDEEAAAVLPQIKAAMTVPLIADIHFDHRLALKAAAVVDCVRINPGNIGASARAMLTMGLTRLVLVAPLRFPDPDAVARASGGRGDVSRASRQVVQPR